MVFSESKWRTVLAFGLMLSAVTAYQAPAVAGDGLDRRSVERFGPGRLGIPAETGSSRSFAEASSMDKVTICHIPPGNPENAHTITIDISALPAHLAHGDTLGPCPIPSCACTVTQGDLVEEILPLVGPMDMASLYSYNDPFPMSGDTGWEVSDTSLLFLYEESLTNEVSLVAIHDRALDGGGGAAIFHFDGLPVGTILAVEDDPGLMNDNYFLNPPVADVWWQWGPCCTDGLAFGQVGCEFEITIDGQFNHMQGGTITAWEFLSGDLDAPEVIPLTIGEPVTITCAPADGKVTLCHIPPGNPANAHQITVDASAVPAHLAHGDTEGPCPEKAGPDRTPELQLAR